MIRIFNGEYQERIKEIRKKTSFFNRPEAQVVRDIVEDVRLNGNRALLNYVSQFESPVSLFCYLKMEQTEIDIAHHRQDSETLDLLRKAIKNIRTYHQNIRLNSWMLPTLNQSRYGVRVTPINRVGVYVPGGTAAYPSSVLMNVIPAQVAGCKEIVLVSPAGDKGKMSDLILAAAKELGVTEIYQMGGAHAIAALAYGTEDLDPVDMICGPGNIYVTLAKKEVYGAVGIDKLAGPSDICIVGDRHCNPKYAAADMLAQAEHDPNASCIFITDDSDIALKVKTEIDQQFVSLTRKDILEEVLVNNSAIFVVKDNDHNQIAEIVNMIAPEHLEIFHDNNQDLLRLIQNAGAIFIGDYSAEVLGDYMLGPNHVLPTGGTARFSSPLSPLDFVKISSMIQLDRRDFKEIGPDTLRFAELENLTAHANSVRVRL